MDGVVNCVSPGEGDGEADCRDDCEAELSTKFLAEGATSFEVFHRKRKKIESGLGLSSEKHYQFPKACKSDESVDYCFYGTKSCKKSSGNPNSKAPV